MKVAEREEEENHYGAEKRNLKKIRHNGGKKTLEEEISERPNELFWATRKAGGAGGQ